jgi:putative endopeptidase
MVRLVPAAVAAVLALGVCQSVGSGGSPPPPASEVTKASDRTLDIGGMDTATEACTDFYQYGNGTWLANNPIPRIARAGALSTSLRQKNLDDLHTILEKLAADKSGAGGLGRTQARRLLRRVHGRGRDRGEGPPRIEPELAKVDAIQISRSLRAEITAPPEDGRQRLVHVRLRRRTARNPRR